MAISLVTYAAMAPTDMMRGLVQKITNESIFLRLLRFIQVNGFAYQYGEQSTLGSIVFRALNEPYSPDTGVVNPRTENLSLFGGQVETDHQMVLTNGDAARASQIAAKVRKAGLFYDRAVIKGDPAIDGRQFPGLNARLGGRQLLSAGNNGGPLIVSLVDELLDRVVGTNDQKFLVMNKATRRALKSAMIDRASGATTADVAMTYDNYDRARIEILDEDGDEQPILAENETWGSNTTTVSMYCIRPGSDTDGEYMQGLVNSDPVRHYESGMRGNMNVDVVESNLGLALFHGRSAARLAGLTVSDT